MLKLLKKLAVLLLILGLPMQSLHALAMPLCNQGDQKTAAQQHSHHGDVVEHEDGPADINPANDGCSLCHACSVPAISATTLVLSIDAVATLPETLGSSLTLFAPEQPQRPPRA